MFGKVIETPQTESTPSLPTKPLRRREVHGHWITVVLPRELLRTLRRIRNPVQSRERAPRPRVQLTRKVTDGVARINWVSRASSAWGTDARRDWGFAGDPHVNAMWRMLQQPTPEDYVVGTGQTWSVRQLCEAAFEAVGLRLQRLRICCRTACSSHAAGRGRMCWWRIRPRPACS